MVDPNNPPSPTSVRAETNYGFMVGKQYGETHLSFHNCNNADASGASFLQALQVSPEDLRTDAIESVSDRIVPACWDWILDHATFDAWLNNDGSHLLWISGGPGKGKTVMAISLVSKLPASEEEGGVFVCDFFCRFMDERANTASAILRGLIHGLAQHQRHLVDLIRDKYKTPEDMQSAQLKELWSLLRGMISKFTGYKTVYLVVDALDECRDDRDVFRLLEFVRKEPFKIPQTSIKWLITSRPSSELERIIGPDVGRRYAIDLEKEEKASKSVDVFIEQAVNGVNGWNQQTKNDVLDFLRKSAENTFLYVSLVWKELYKIPEWKVPAQLSELQNSNPGSILHRMYRLMLDRTVGLDNKSGNTYRQDILRVVLLATRAVNWQELAIAAGLPRQSYEYDDESAANGQVSDLIQQCGHFLLLRDGKVHFFHKSASDYLSMADGEGSSFLSLLPSLPLGHARIAHQCLVEHCSTLKTRDFPEIDTIIKRRLPRSEIQKLRDLSYIYCYWTTHVVKAHDHFTDYSLVRAFFQDNFLPWLETMGHLNQIPQSIQMIQELMHASANVWIWQGLPEADMGVKTSLDALLHDAFRFILRYQASIDQDPTQVYFLAMFFAPKHSLTRLNCRKRVSSCLKVVPELSENWGPYLYSNRGGAYHESGLDGTFPKFTLGFSEDSTILFRVSERRIAKWNVADGSSAGSVWWPGRVVLTSQHGNILASEDDTTKSLGIWEVETKSLLSVINRSGIKTMAPNGKTITIQVTELRYNGPFLPSYAERIVSTSFLELYETKTGNLIQQIKCAEEDYLSSLGFSPDGRLLAIEKRGFNGVLLWDMGARSFHSLHFSDAEVPSSVVFSSSGDILITLSSYKEGRSELDTITFWDTESMSIMVRLVGHHRLVVAISPDGKIAAVASKRSVSLWDIKELASSGEPSQYLVDFPGREYHVLATWNHFKARSLAFSSCGDFLAGMDTEGSFRVWDLRALPYEQRGLQETPRLPRNLASSPDGRICSAKSTDLHRLKTAEDALQNSSLVLSPNALICGTSTSGQSALWETATGSLKIRLTGQPTPISYLKSLSTWAFSPDSLLALAILDETIVLIRTTSSEPAIYSKITRGCGRLFFAEFAFNQDSTLLALFLCGLSGIRLIETSSGTELRNLQSPNSISNLTFSPTGKLAAWGKSREEKRLLLWDKPHTGSCVTMAPPEEERGFLDSLVSAFDLFTKTDSHWEVTRIAWSPDEESMAVAWVSWSPDSSDKTVKHHVFQVTNMNGPTAKSRLLWSGSDGPNMPPSLSTDLCSKWGPTALCVLDSNHFAIAWPSFVHVNIQNGSFYLSTNGLFVHSLQLSSDKRFILTNRVAIPLDSSVKQKQAHSLGRDILTRRWVTLKGNEILILPDDIAWKDEVTIPGCLAISDLSGNVAFFSIQSSSGDQDAG